MICIVMRPKLFTRNCPRCHKELGYTTKQKMKEQEKLGGVCYNCRAQIRPNSMTGATTRKTISDKAIERWKNYTEEQRAAAVAPLIHYANNQPEWTEQERLNVSGPKNHFYGKHHSDETKDLLRKVHTGTKITAEHRMKISQTLRDRGVNVGNKNGAKRPEVRDKIRKSVIRYIQETHGHALPFYSPTACQYFDRISDERGWKLRHAMNGGEVHLKEVGYFLDAYDSERNIVVEYDEPRHYYADGRLKHKDIRRQAMIIEHLKCRFFRYDERESILYEVTRNDDIQITGDVI
jgi:hypothetical protein